MDATGIFGRQYGPFGLFGEIAGRTVAPAATAIWRGLSVGPTAPAQPPAPAVSAARLRYEADNAEVTRIAGEQRNLLRGLTLCGVVALCGASAFMQLAIIFWPVAVVMIWGAGEGAWVLAGEWLEGRRAYKDAVARRNVSSDALVAEEAAASAREADTQSHGEAAHVRQLPGAQRGPDPTRGLLPPRTQSSARGNNRGAR